MNKLLVRFLEIRYTSYEDPTENADYICSIEIESYDRFFNFLKSLKENDIPLNLKKELYNIYLFEVSYGGHPEEDLLSLDVYVIPYC